ncbi:LysR family transcriptional regulator [Rhizobium sp. BK060]|uniref:LysR family transcriptional regulator n=1 Tax=Rhizobium sp. BK060 TaxID=2587096 RepID=UPI00160BA3A1|nr:LysR family transcriptional regulator [Rhizobium sp. BK060]MBB3395992.1 DNA-binding transcriptional LysR family regulator [Rhizobium sp. BK060]
MDWDDLRVFLHIARTGQVNEAARLLDLDHSTVSRRLTRLEDAVGAKLFNRAGRRLKINASGTALLSIASRMEAILFREVGSVADDAGELSGFVRVGAPEGFGASYLSARLDELRSGYDSLEIELVALPQNYSLASREVDVAITLDRPRSGNIATRRLTNYSLGFFASSSYIEEIGRPDALAELANHRICGYIPSLLHTRELDYLDAVGYELRASLRSTSIIAQKSIIETGQAIGILPFFMVEDESRLERLLQDSFQLTRSYWLSVHDDLRQQARVRVAVDALVSIVRRDAVLFNGPKP